MTTPVQATLTIATATPVVDVATMQPRTTIELHTPDLIVMAIRPEVLVRAEQTV